MRTRQTHFSSRLSMMALALALGQASALAFTLREIGEWVVSCDNMATCSLVNASQVTQTRVAQPSPLGMSRICIHRRGGPADAPQLFLTLRGRLPKNYASRQEERLLRIAGNRNSMPDIVLHHRGTEHWEVPEPQVRALLAGLDGNAQFHIVTRDGATLDRLSVQGIDGALSAIDQAQSRTGTVTALRETGGKPAAIVPARPELPAVVTASFRRLDTTTAPSSETQRLRREVCRSSGDAASTAYRLLGDRRRPDRILWVMPCDAAAGRRHAFFAIENADGSAEPVSFAGLLPNRPTAREGLLASPDFDAESGMVRERWIASIPPAQNESCAIGRSWGWTGQAFELVEERRSLSCVGLVSGYWPKTYTRPVIKSAPEGASANATPFQPPC